MLALKFPARRRRSTGARSGQRHPIATSFWPTSLVLKAAILLYYAAHASNIGATDQSKPNLGNYMVKPLVFHVAFQLEIFYCCRSGKRTRTRYNCQHVAIELGKSPLAAKKCVGFRYRGQPIRRPNGSV